MSTAVLLFKSLLPVIPSSQEKEQSGASIGIPVGYHHLSVFSIHPPQGHINRRAPSHSNTYMLYMYTLNIQQNPKNVKVLMTKRQPLQRISSSILCFHSIPNKNPHRLVREEVVEANMLRMPIPLVYPHKKR